MGIATLLASVIAAGIVCFGLFVYVILLVTNFSHREREALLRGNMTQEEWRRRFASLVGGCSLACFVLLIVSLYGLVLFGESLGRLGDEARSARYDACLERTTAEVCEIHWVRQSQPAGEGGPSLVITSDGKIGTGFGL